MIKSKNLLEFIMDYKELYSLISKFDEALKNYVIQRDEINDSYYVAKVFLSELSEKSYKNTSLINEFGNWLKSGSTIELKNVLRHTKYDDDDLIHFNAFSLIDTVRGTIY